MKVNRLLAIAATMATSMTVESAHAQNGGGSVDLQVSAVLLPSCEVSFEADGATLDFGVYDPRPPGFAWHSTQLGFEVQCPPGVEFRVGIGAGQSGSASINRMMANTSDAEQLLHYTLHYAPQPNNTPTAEVWGVTDMMMPPPVTSSGDPVSHTVYGYIARNQDRSPGTYAELVPVIIFVN